MSTIARKPSRCKWSPCSTIRHTREKPAQLLALYPRRGERSKCGTTTPARSPIDRTSYLNVRSLFDQRIQRTQRTPADLAAVHGPSHSMRANTTDSPRGRYVTLE